MNSRREPPRPTRVCSRLVAWALLLGFEGAAGRVLTAQEATFPSEVEIVRLDVVVVDRDGHPVAGLTADDFEIEEEGRRREIASFEPIVVASVRSPPAGVPTPTPSLAAQPRGRDPREGRCVLVFFDDVHLSPEVAPSVRSQLGPFLEREVRDGDWVTLVAPQADVWWTARTAWERRQLPAVVARLQGYLKRSLDGGESSDYKAMQMVEYGSRTGADAESRLGPQGSPMAGGPAGYSATPFAFESAYAAACRRIRMTLRGLRLAVHSLLGFRGRKSLILYSEGFIRAPRVEREEFVGLVDLARRANVAIYYVDAVGLPVSGATFRLDQERGGAIHVALESGGRTSSSNDATAELRRVLGESSAYYLIGFSPQAGGAEEKRVDIQVRRPDLRVLARTRRVFPDRTAPREELPWEAVALRSVSDAEDLPLKVAIAFPEDDRSRPDASDPRAKRRKAGARRVLARIDVGLAAGDGRALELVLLTEARARDGGKPVLDVAKATIESAKGTAVIERRWLLAPGVWQFRVVAKDAASGRLGSALVTFDVAPKG